MLRTCATDVRTIIQHEIDIPSCCPVSRNPYAGSRMKLMYRSAGIVLPVEDLRDMVAEYVGGHRARDVRNMEEMIQDLAKRAAEIVKVPVIARADLVVVPHGGGAPQMLRVKCHAG